MRKRGAILILAAMPAWVYIYHFISQVERSGFGYEFGSVAWPFPPLYRVTGMFALICTLVGLFLLLFDFVQWIRTRSRDSHQ
jgi:hypothetical protein